MATLPAPGVSATARGRVDVTDHELVEAVRAGDDGAFERLYERYHRRIAAYVVGMVRDHGRAEDLTQEVFVSALRRMRQTDRPIHFKPWIYEIAKNACIDAFRRSRRAEEVSFDAEQQAGDVARLATTTATPEAAAAERQRIDHLWGAFDGLSDAHHQILVLRELEGLSYAEIGERLGMSHASVESTLFRARRRLTEEFQELQTGEACRRAQGLIDTATTAALGRRDERRLGRHIARCAPCRREAALAGLDAAVLARRPVRARVGALLPLPAFLQRRWIGGAPGGGHHLAQWTAAAAPYGEASAGWVKAVAAVTAVALAGAGAGVGTAVSGHGAQRHAAPARPAASAVAARRRQPAAGAATSPRGRSGHHGGRHRGAASHRHRGSHRPGATTRGGRAVTGGGAGGRGGAGTSTSAPAGTTGGGGSTGGGTRTGGGGSTGDGAHRTSATGSGGSSSPATAQPLVDPDPGALTQPPPSGSATSDGGTVGGVVEQTTAAAGDVVGGSVGQAVQDTGAAAGSAIDQTTTTATDAVQGAAGADGSTVEGVTRTAAATAGTVVQTTQTTVADVTGALGSALGGR